MNVNKPGPKPQGETRPEDESPEGETEGRDGDQTPEETNR